LVELIQTERLDGCERSGALEARLERAPAFQGTVVAL